MDEWITTSTVLEHLRDFEDAQAWGRFDARFRWPIVRFARGLGLPAPEAEDVAQETLLAFLHGYREGRYDASRGRLSKWLFGIAYRQAANARRDRAQRAIRAGTPAEELRSSFWSALPEEDAASRAWDEEWERWLLDRCMEQVRKEVEPLTFQAFELTVREQRAAPEAAAALGVSVKLIYNAKHRVLQRIRELRLQVEEV